MNEEAAYPRLLPHGEAAVSVEFGNCIQLELNQRVYALEAAIETAKANAEPASPLRAIETLIPSYRSLLVMFDPLATTLNELFPLLQDLISRSQNLPPRRGRVVEIPVTYGGEEGPDLAFVAETNGLTPQEVIEIHCSRDYPVYMMGFTPGFPYLGGVDPRIAAPRLPNPRESISAGSVGIAGTQTGIYSLTSPGGWRIIGRTAIPLFAPSQPNPFLLSPGDFVRFIALNPTLEE